MKFELRKSPSAEMLVSTVGNALRIHVFQRTVRAASFLQFARTLPRQTVNPTEDML